MNWLLLLLIFTPDGVTTAHNTFPTEAACEAKSTQLRSPPHPPFPFTTLCIDLTIGDPA